mmetsp:Transcript_38638/g.122738  ORF Transcript_38638/g.122738 Transcript_38638/m.122738 type:complete len:340 (-) Transcript_38638:48-1067(-)
MKEVPSSPAAPLLLPEGYRPFEDGAKAEEGALDGVEYSSDELDAVALLLTAVKVMFVGGALERALAVAEKVAPARAASLKPLHETLIRNEAAYYSCAKQLLQDHPIAGLPRPAGVAADEGAGVPSSSAPPVYLIGDSHSLTGAWRTIKLRGEPRLLSPVLVTGLKIWHLRDESKFYPKMNFLNQLKAVPRGAQVVMMFGEIDCREGLLVAVERCKYTSVEQGMRATIAIYIKALTDLVGRREMEVFVHPVPPVLKETRHIVMPFNKILRGEVEAASRKGACRGKLHWLDFVDSLLDTTPGAANSVAPWGALRKDLDLDGTHMNPAYVRELSAAMAGLGV